MVALAVVACDQNSRSNPPLGEAIVYVDTDMPVVTDGVSVPTLVNRLRIDVYSGDGSVWYESQDVDRSNAEDWPASFAVSLGDGEGERSALVRLRAYAAGNVRDYRGERYLERPMGSTSQKTLQPSLPFAADDCPECLRLLDGSGNDITPPTEPMPALAIDRLLLLSVSPGVVGATSALLAGACTGTMADLYGLRTCVDTDGVLEDVNVETPGAEPAAPPTSQQGSFEALYARPCTAALRTPTPGLYDDEVCVPGGLFVLGSYDGFGNGDNDDVPLSMAAMPSFRMDKYEVTVGRWRAAIAAGLRSPDLSPSANEGPLVTSDTDPTSLSLCTWSAMPRGRESYAITCITWAAARALCQWERSDLPTEAQWEFAVAVAGRAAKTRYAWGGDDGILPTCSRAVFGRGISTSPAGQECNPHGTQYGPLAVDARDSDAGDRSDGLGIVGLGGGVEEYALDALVSRASACWYGAALESPRCDPPGTSVRVSRGAGWDDGIQSVPAAARTPMPMALVSTSQGFRCVRPAGDP